MKINDMSKLPTLPVCATKFHDIINFHVDAGCIVNLG